MPATATGLHYPSLRVLLSRTRLAYVHLKNLLGDAKRDHPSFLPDVESVEHVTLQDGGAHVHRHVRDGQRNAQRTGLASAAIPSSADRLKVVGEDRALVADDVAAIAAHAHPALDLHSHHAIGCVGDTRCQ